MIIDDLLPRVTREFVRQFGREVPELEKFRVKLQTLHDVLRDSYCFNRAPVWLDAILGWSVDPEAKLSVRYGTTIHHILIIPWLGCHAGNHFYVIYVIIAAPMIPNPLAP